MPLQNVIGLSVLSGAHIALARKVVAELQREEAAIPELVELAGVARAVSGGHRNGPSELGKTGRR